jgi:hypothetical protein
MRYLLMLIACWPRRNRTAVPDDDPAEFFHCVEFGFNGLDAWQVAEGMMLPLSIRREQSYSQLPMDAEGGSVMRPFWRVAIPTRWSILLTLQNNGRKSVVGSTSPGLVPRRSIQPFSAIRDN